MLQIDDQVLAAAYCASEDEPLDGSCAQQITHSIDGVRSSGARQFCPTASRFGGKPFLVKSNTLSRETDTPKTMRGYLSRVIWALPPRRCFLASTSPGSGAIGLRQKDSSSSN